MLVRGIEPLPERAIPKASRSVDRGSSDCFQGSRFLDLSRWPLHPPMHNGKAVSLAILMAYTFGGPAADGVDDVDKAVEGIKANWVAMKGFGAVNTRCIVTGGKLLEPCRSG